MTLEWPLKRGWRGCPWRIVLGWGVGDGGRVNAWVLRHVGLYPSRSVLTRFLDTCDRPAARDASRRNACGYGEECTSVVHAWR